MRAWNLIGYNWETCVHRVFNQAEGIPFQQRGGEISEQRIDAGFIFGTPLPRGPYMTTERLAKLGLLER